MRKLATSIMALATLVAGVVAYFVVTTPSTSAGVRFPLSAAQRAWIASVPASAESFAFVPAAAAIDAKLRTNPITLAPLEDWESHQTLPSPWMIGRGDLLAWREGKQTRYFVRLDPVRALVVRLVLMIRGDPGTNLLLNAPGGETLPADEVTRIAALAETLPNGDALVVQRGSHRAFPPIGRPAVTSVQITATDVVLTCHAAVEAGSPPAAPLTAQFPRGAMLTYVFSSPPRALNDLNRLLGSRVADLLDGGGQLSIYDVDLRKLLPRPLGVIALPAGESHRAALDAFLRGVAPAEGMGVHARTAERNGQLVLSFDDSIDTYIKDATDAASWPAARWAVRMDPHRLVPVVDDLRDNIGLRLAAPHVSESVRDLDRWSGGLREAGRIDGVDAVKGQVEELQVRISK
jgi:hypothetical protein